MYYSYTGYEIISYNTYITNKIPNARRLELNAIFSLIGIAFVNANNRSPNTQLKS